MGSFFCPLGPSSGDPVPAAGPDHRHTVGPGAAGQAVPRAVGRREGQAAAGHPGVAQPLRNLAHTGPAADEAGAGRARGAVQVPGRLRRVPGLAATGPGGRRRAGGADRAAGRPGGQAPEAEGLRRGRHLAQGRPALHHHLWAEGGGCCQGLQPWRSGQQRHSA